MATAVAVEPSGHSALAASPRSRACSRWHARCLSTLAMKHAVWMTCILIGCGSTSDDNDLLPPPAKGEGIQLSYSAVAQPGEEIWKCNVSDLPTDKYLDVNRVESVQNDSVHHMDLMAIALAAPNLAPGEYDCAPLYAQYPSLMDQAVTLYASQQATQQVQLPEGTVAELLPKLRVMHEVHYLNTSEEPVTVYSKINAYAYPQDKATQNIWGGAVRDLDITVPAGATDHVEWTRCVMNGDVDVLFLTSHTHKLADRTVIRPFDGHTTREPIYMNTDWHAPPLHDMTSAPLHVAAGTGFEFECHYSNPGSADVHWGFTAADEMCQMALVYTPGDTTRKCEITESGVR